MQRHLVQREIAGVRYGIRALTLEEIDAWYLAVMAAGETPAAWKRWLRKLAIWIGLYPQGLPDVYRTPVDIMLFEDVVLYDLRYLTDLPEAAIRKLEPGQIRQVWAACKEVNEDFFAMRRRLETVGMATLDVSAANSNLPYHA